MSNMESYHDDVPAMAEDPKAHLKALEDSLRWASFDSCDSVLADEYHRSIAQLLDEHPELAETYSSNFVQ